MFGSLLNMLFSSALMLPHSPCQTAQSCARLCAPAASLASVDDLPELPQIAPEHEDEDPRYRTQKCLSALASLGPSARSQAAHVAEYLQVPDRSIRLLAAWTLGRIGAVGQTHALRARLTDRSWQVVAETMRSLVRLQDHASLPALRRLANTHPYPLIRGLARRAVDAIRTGHPAALDAYFTYTPNRPSVEQHLGWSQNPFARWHVWQAAAGASPPDWICPSPERASVAVERSSANWAGGRLIGEDRGEFGGGLYWRKDGRSHRLLAMNVQHIQVIDATRAWVLAGYAHLGADRGALLQVEQLAGNLPRVRRLLDLPGRPTAMRSAAAGISVHTSTGNFRLLPTSQRGGFELHDLACAGSN